MWFRMPIPSSNHPSPPRPAGGFQRWVLLFSFDHTSQEGTPRGGGFERRHRRFLCGRAAKRRDTPVSYRPVALTHGYDTPAIGPSEQGTLPRLSSVRTFLCARRQDIRPCCFKLCRLHAYRRKISWETFPTIRSITGWAVALCPVSYMARAGYSLPPLVPLVIRRPCIETKKPRGVWPHRGFQCKNRSLSRPKSFIHQRPHLREFQS